ncbi:hypothetical protein V8J88_20510 [Massilia sp. W12]|uniref:hypothetical protein n=1 Tax=Massilia sp. W12 TaxID=3126507 RepID=UPI0030D32C26
MLNKLEYEALAADLAAVNALLADRTEDEDPIGWMQYSFRKKELEQKLSKMQQNQLHHAQLGLFFGGGPVLGSRGIHADFAGQALNMMQTLIKSRCAEVEMGPLKQRGKLPQTERSQLIVTQILRGSIGFVLEEAGENSEIIDTPLKEVVDEISQLLIATAEGDSMKFEQASESLDQRILNSLRGFFALLDEQEATLRIVCGEKDSSFNREAIQSAYLRLQALEIHEFSKELCGVLYVRPGKRDFELHYCDAGQMEKLDGKLLPQAIAQIAGQAELEGTQLDPENIVGRRWRVLLNVKEYKERKRERTSYALQSLLGLADELAH